MLQACIGVAVLLSAVLVFIFLNTRPLPVFGIDHLTSADPTLVIDLARRMVLDCNDAAARYLGYARHEMVGQHYDTLRFASPQHDFDAARVVLEQEGEVLDLERTFVHKNGQRLDVSLNVIARRNQAGRFIAKAVIHDVTHRKQMERNNELIAAISMAFRPGVIPAELTSQVCLHIARHCDASEAVIVDVDAAAGHLIVRGEPQPKRDLALYGRDFVTAQRAGQLGRSGAVLGIPYLVDGQWAASLIVVTRRPEGYSMLDIALLQSVSVRLWFWLEQDEVAAAAQQARTNELVRHSEEPFRALVDAVKDYGIYLLDPSGRVTSWNTGAQRLKGYTADEIVGTDFAAFYTEEDRAKGHPRNVLSRARIDGRYEEDGLRVRKDGSLFWANVIVTALYHEDGSLRGYANVTRDFSTRHAAAQEIEQKQKQLVASLREREVLLQEVHHRVKNNLQVISSLINMQMRQLDDPAARSALEECKSRVESIALIHQKLYEFKDYATVPFASYARSLTASIMISSARSNVTMDVQLDDVALSVDKAIPCGLILNELVTNALKHAFPNDRGGHIRVELNRTTPTRLQLAVHDDGVGMPPPFDTKRPESLGMKLVTTLVEQLEGELIVATKSGAHFEVDFSV